jgi:uncharacterized protein YndB with AHSA1/START domain
MVDIRHRVGTSAPRQAAYDAFATTEGLAGWWTEVTGDAAEGGSLRFQFGQPERSVTMQVVEAKPAERVTWRCVSGPDEWVDTTIDFQLHDDGDETVVVFTHGGWREPVEFMHHCSTKWAVFLVGLKQGLDGGTATPFPNEAVISSWS